MADLEQGLDCPCCERFIKVYTRRLSEGMARWLVWLYFVWCESDDDGWDTTPPKKLRLWFGGDYHKLKHWGFVEQRTNTDKKKKTSGVWRITQWGRDFVDGTMAAPAYVRLLTDERVRFSDENVLFHQLYGTHFDIREVMGHAEE